MWIKTRAEAGPPKNSEITSDAVSRMYLSAKFLHPTQNSIRGQFSFALAAFSSGLQSLESITMDEMIMRRRMMISVVMKMK
jgi:hypothetical protein